MHILVTGRNGQLGSEIAQLSGQWPEAQFYFTDVAELDITNEAAVHAFFEENPIDLVINCAAYTEVDAAEDNPVLCDAVNHLGVKNLVKACEAANAKLIQISTDYVFDGTNHKPYTPEDKEQPIGVYGQTKYLGEQAVLNSKVHGMVIRTSWVYSKYGNNFVKTMLKLGQERDSLGVIADQIGSPTHAKTLAQAIIDIAKQQELWTSGVEVYHYSNQGVCSWYDFATAIMTIKNIGCKVNALGTKEYPTKAERPAYSVMDKSRITTQFNIEIPHWRAELKVFLKSLA